MLGQGKNKLTPTDGAASGSKSGDGKTDHLGITVATHSDWRHLSPQERRLKNVYAALGISPTAKRPKPEQWGRHTKVNLVHDRKSAALPHASYDIDGDGGVGPVDHFLAREVDKEPHKGFLTSSERNKAREMHRDGSYDELILKHRGQDIIHKSPGVIVTKDDFYRPMQRYDHPKKREPAHETRTEMHADRLAELRDAGAAIYEKHLTRCVPRTEDSPSRTGVGGFNDYPQPEGMINNCRERARKEAALVRVASGQTPEPTLMNPEREMMHPGLDYVVSPTCATRSELLAKRKEENTLELIRKRNHQEETFTCHSARRSAQMEELYRTRQDDKPEKTLSILKLNRKREAMEYEMEHAKKLERNRPFFSEHGDGNVPFWLLGEPNGKTKPSLVQFQSAPDLSARKDLRPTAQLASLSPKKAGPAQDPSGSDDATHHKRKTEPPKPKDDEPRMFDRLRTPLITVEDLYPLDRFSSFNLIREGSYAQPNFQIYNKHVKETPYSYSSSALASSRSVSPDRKDGHVMEGSVGHFSVSVDEASKSVGYKIDKSISGYVTPSITKDPTTSSAREQSYGKSIATASQSYSKSIVSRDPSTVMDRDRRQSKSMKSAVTGLMMAQRMSDGASYITDADGVARSYCKSVAGSGDPSTMVPDRDRRQSKSTTIISSDDPDMGHGRRQSKSMKSAVSGLMMARRMSSEAGYSYRRHTKAGPRPIIQSPTSKIPTVTREIQTPETLGFLKENRALTKIRSAGFFKPYEEKFRTPRRRK